MQTEPEIVQRAEQPYVAIKASVTMETIGTVLPQLHPEMFAWLDAHGVRPAGAPFSKYKGTRRVREAAWGNGPVEKPKPRPRPTSSRDCAEA
jgi:hypothetical protein